MIASAAASARHPVEELAEDFLTRFRRGERPSLGEYVQQFPDVADELADIIQVLLVLEGLRSDADDAKESASPLPERLGEYRLVREIGRGGMGIVYEAEQVELGRHVALKILPTIALLRPTHLERFRRESRAAARLHHTNIIPVYGIGAQDGIHYYAMQYISGRGLEAILRDLRKQRSNPVAETDRGAATLLSGSNSAGTSEHHREVAGVGLQIAEALAYAHAHGVMHRDVKPANVILDDQGTAWLGDFGLAYLEGDEPLTGTGSFVGTLLYLAPERFKGEGDARSDVYSLGATLYELLTLRPMFDATDRSQLIRQVTQDEPPPPRRIDRAIPRDLETLVLKAIAKNPDDRYTTCGELAEDLRRFMADRPLAARRISKWELFRRWVRRNPVVFASLTAVVLSLGIGLAATFWQWRRAETNLAAKTDALGQADLQKERAQAHGRRAFVMLDRLMSDLTMTPEGQPGPETHRQLLKRALQIHQDFLSQNIAEPAERIDVARLAILAADLNRELRELGQSERCYRMALKLVEPEASDPESPATCRELNARALTNLGSQLQLTSARRPEAQVLLQRGEEMYRQLIKEQPSERFYRRNHSIALRHLALIARSKGQFEKAIAMCRESVEVCRELLNEDINDTRTQMALAQQWIVLTRLYERLNKWEDAESSIKSAVKLADDLINRVPQFVAYHELSGDCEGVFGDVLVNQARVITAKDAAGALRCFGAAEIHARNCLASRQRIFDKNRANGTYRAKLADAFNNLGYVLMFQKRFDEAEPLLLRAIDEQKECIRTQSRSVNNTRSLVNHYRAFGENRCRKGDYVKAAEVVPEMTKIRTGDGQEFISAAKLLSLCGEQANRDKKIAAEDRTRLAEKYNQQAIDCLRHGVGRGYANRESLQASAELSYLRTRSDFLEIVKTLPAKIKAPDDSVD